MKQFFVQILSTEPFDILKVLPWVVVALAVVMLAFILIKCFSIYRTLKQNRTYAKQDGEVVPLLAIRGEYFVLSCGVEYDVGESGQLKAGKYVLRGDGYDKFQVALNGEERELNSNDTVQLNDGDKLVAVSCDLLTKPCQEDTQDTTTVNNGLTD